MGPRGNTAPGEVEGGAVRAERSDRGWALLRGLRGDVYAEAARISVTDRIKITGTPPRRNSCLSSQESNDVDDDVNVPATFELGEDT